MPRASAAKPGLSFGAKGARSVHERQHRLPGATEAGELVEVPPNLVALAETRPHVVALGRKLEAADFLNGAVACRGTMTDLLLEGRKRQW